MSKISKIARRSRVRKRIRSKIFGTAEKPRLSVFKSSKHVYVQIINDQKHATLAAASTMSKDLKSGLEGKTKMEKAELIGETIGKKAGELGISKVVFDRSGYKYHGIVKNVAEGARKGGLQF